MSILTVMLLSLALGALVGAGLTMVGVALKGLAAERRRLRERAGLQCCPVCEGAGYYRDITWEYQQERAARLV